MALYLKYRPQTFSDMVGQDFIKKTLKAAVAQEKTVGAYLFTGPRGTGKTSSARIFARAINCMSPKQGDPCLECEVCQEFERNALIDIIEIDAASHTGVDNIRDIIDKAQFQPTKTRYKVYIIDEVHMLSKGAFNALLKILEEPPKHVKFILATTEIHKVPDTILSRCQRYDFKNFTDAEIIARLEYIASQECISVDTESYEYIAKTAQGGMRNAVSLFEQLIQNKTISYQEITQTLGIAGDDMLRTLGEKLLVKDVSVLDDIDRLLGEGKNIKHLFLSLSEQLQKTAISGLQSGKDVQKEILLLDSIHELLMKLKHSFDEALTVHVEILKILSSQIRQEQISKPSSKNSPEISSQNTTQQHNIPTQKIQKEAIQNSKDETDILSQAKDIFGDASDVTSKTTSSSDQMNIEKLIDEVKKLGGKAALTMSIKGSTFQMQDKVLHITTKTNIAHSTIAKIENREHILQALENMQYTIDDIKIL